MLFYDGDELSLRLRQSIISYNSLPVFVRDTSVQTTTEGLVEFLHISRLSQNSGEGEIKKVALKDSKINLKPVKLGYCNYSNRAYYLTRRPERRWKQGLALNAIQISPLRHEKLKTIVFSREMENSILNKFPSLSESLEIIKTFDYEGSIAFSLKLAVYKNKIGVKFLHFRNEEVGFFKDNKVKLGPQYTYLKEYLKSEGVPLWT